MLNAMRTALLTHKAILISNMEKQRESSSSSPSSSSSLSEYEDVLTSETVFWMATQGGAEALNLGNEIGSFEVGKCFDALVVDIEDTQEHREETDEQHQHYIPQKQQHQQHKHLHNIDPFDIGRPATDMEEFERFVHLGDSRNIKQVWVNGKRRC